MNQVRLLFSSRLPWQKMPGSRARLRVEFSHGWSDCSYAPGHGSWPSDPSCCHPSAAQVLNSSWAGRRIRQIELQRTGPFQRQVQILLVQRNTESGVQRFLSPIRSPCTSRIFEDAKPPINAWRILAGSAPALEANNSASDTASRFKAHDNLVGYLTSLTVTIATH